MSEITHGIEMALYYAQDDPTKLKEIVFDLIRRIEEDEFNEADLVRAEMNEEIEDIGEDHKEALLKEEEKTARMERNRDLWQDRAEEAGYEVPETPFNVHNFKDQYNRPYACCTLCHKIEGEAWMDDRITLTHVESEEIKSRIEDVCGDDELIAQILGEYWEKIPKERRTRLDRAKGKRK
jgi:hypothetical protein